MDLKLRGRKALVTGATRGIGLQIAKQLASEGVHLGICARTPEVVEATAETLRGEGVEVVGQAVDVTEGEALTGWIESSARALGGLDIYVSNVSGTPSRAGEDGWRDMFEADMLGAVRACETALPFLRESDAASIVLISSISGVMSKPLKAPGILAYGSMKAALISYGAQMSRQLAGDGIRVNTVSPGPVYFEGGPWDMIRQHLPDAYQDALDHCVIGRLGTPEDIANAVLFLASPVSSFTTGQNLHVDGGYMEHVAF